MKVLLAILKICGNRIEKMDGVIEKEEKKTRAFDDRVMVLVMSPDTKNSRYWLVFTSIFYLIGIVQDMIVVARHNYPLF